MPNRLGLENRVIELSHCCFVIDIALAVLNLLYIWIARHFTNKNSIILPPLYEVLYAYKWGVMCVKEVSWLHIKTALYLETPEGD